jgi:hypothetical protein
MRKVIDSSMLQSAELRRYLKSSALNYAVLPDYVSMEAYKVGSVERILERWQIISQFPKQVVILKGTSQICGLNGRGKGLQQRLIDHRQTLGFEEFCDGLKLARAGDARYSRELERHGAAGKEEMDKLLALVPAVIKDRGALVSGYTEDERRALRAGKIPPECLKAQFVGSVMELASLMFGGHPSITSAPTDLDDLLNRHIFRFALAVHIWLMEWVVDGCMEGSNLERVRNDFVDINAATYATYFDGLMTADSKLLQTYAISRLLLNGIRGNEQP